MDIVTIFEQLASTTHHKIKLEELLVDVPVNIKQIFANNDVSSLKAFFNGDALLADRNTIFEL